MIQKICVYNFNQRGNIFVLSFWHELYFSVLICETIMIVYNCILLVYIRM